MATESDRLTIQDLRDSCWKDVIVQSEKKDCSHYHSLFLARFKHAEESSNQKQQNVFRLLTDITSLFMRSDNRKEPYGPMAVMDGKRSAIIDDFSEEQLNILKEFIPEIDDPELRARISDVIWLRQRDYKVAEIAIDSYLESANKLEDPDHWPSCFDRIERAFRLAASLGDSNGKFDKVVEHIENMLGKYDGNDPLYLSEKLMGLLCESKEGDPVKYSLLAEKLATNAEKAHDWQRAQTHWLRKAEWDRIGKNVETRKSSLISAAETYVKLAEGSISGERKSYMVASSHLTKAIEAYRRIGGMKDRIDELHSILLTYEKESLKEFGVISSPPMDLSKAIEGDRESVKGKSVIDSLFIFSQNFRIETVENLKKRIQDHIKIAPLSYMMSGVIVNEKGKVVGKKQGLLLADKDEQEIAIRPHMFQEAKMGYWVDVQALIDPMRGQINVEHYITVNDLAPIIVNNPFIPEHREYFFGKGLLAGLQGDFITAIHFLVPQFENSLRYLLEQQGVPTSGIDDDGIQEEYDLNKLLYLEDTKKLFGENLIFHLQGLLVEKEGANIRNRMAHGLMYPGDFHSPDCIYLWALILRLYCWPSMTKIFENHKEDKQHLSGEVEV